MVVDTSALIAILNNEPERAAFLDKIQRADRCFISALNLYEAQLVALAKLGEQGLGGLIQLIDELGLSVVSFDRLQADLCTEAYRRFGKGLGSSASLNLCDCASYTLAQSLNLSLLFKGSDFAATDIAAA